MALGDALLFSNQLPEAERAEVERDVRNLLPEEPRLVAALLRQVDGDVRVAVDPVLEVQRRLPVPGDHVELHRTEAKRRLV